MFFQYKETIFHHKDGQTLGQVTQRGYKLSVHGGAQNLTLSNLTQLQVEGRTRPLPGTPSIQILLWFYSRVSNIKKEKKKEKKT